LGGIDCSSCIVVWFTIVLQILSSLPDHLKSHLRVEPCGPTSAFFFVLFVTIHSNTIGNQQVNVGSPEQKENPLVVVKSSDAYVHHPKTANLLLKGRGVGLQDIIEKLTI
jgi:hypothetical protein